MKMLYTEGKKNEFIEMGWIHFVRWEWMNGLYVYELRCVCVLEKDQPSRINEKGKSIRFFRILFLKPHSKFYMSFYFDICVTNVSVTRLMPNANTIRKWCSTVHNNGICKRTSGALSKNSHRWKWLPFVNSKEEAIPHDWQQSHEFYRAIYRSIMTARAIIWKPNTAARFTTQWNGAPNSTDAGNRSFLAIKNQN